MKKKPDIENKKILPKHPEEKKLPQIDKSKYDPIRAAILEALTQHGELKFQELAKAVEQKVAGNFVGSINWYTTVVKLDLEANKIIERVPGTRPHKVRLVKK